jgi:hypothetical protein
MEGMEIFKYPEIEMVYTRRIIDPAFGAKLSGKTGRFAYSVLSSYDLHPSESLWDVHNGGGCPGRDGLRPISLRASGAGKRRPLSVNAG